MYMGKLRLVQHAFPDPRASPAFVSLPPIFHLSGYIPRYVQIPGPTLQPFAYFKLPLQLILDSFHAPCTYLLRLKPDNL